ncbi:MAG: glycosyltransferase [candidate division Zixibacteria bacterium]|nr:glycosyltransferase [candidate division Zixibacteria bacterium]
MIVYTIRHFVFTLNRISGEQRIYYQDIVDSDLPRVSVIVPMHNEEKVASYILAQLTKADYPRDRFEIIPIDDHSEDQTGAIIDKYASRFPVIKPLYRNSGIRGKTHALNEALQVARGKVIVVFDADYLPPAGIVRDIAVSFKDPEVGAVMGRVIPRNTKSKLLTRLLDLERSGGYQVDQQARHNMKLMPQYGGTVGGFRRDVVLSLGGFNPKILTEDTELTFKLVIAGWKVIYANRAECFEEVTETWSARARQISRWARGHSQVMLWFIKPFLKSKNLTLGEKIDGILLMGIFFIPLIILVALPVTLALFFLGEMNILNTVIIFLLVAAYNAFGNFAPFFQIGTAAFIDGTKSRVNLLPFFFFSFLYNIIYVSKGSLTSIVDVVFNRDPVWQKTTRFRQKG